MDSQRDLHHYQAFGLDIQSAIPLVGLRPSRGGNCDVEVRCGSIDHEMEPRRVDEDRSFWAKGSRACHVLDGVGAFLVSEGAEILVDEDDDVQEGPIQLSLLGPAMGLVLIQRGYYVFHGSTVSIQGQSVTFLGGCGTGKSTIAAVLHRLGYTFVSDDLTAVSVEDLTPHVVPGYPQLKLWPDAARSLEIFSEDLPRVHPDHDKRFVVVSRGFSLTPQPLKRLYVLDVGDTVSIQPFSAIQCFDIIVANWYGARFGKGYLGVLDLGKFFLQAGLLARQVPVKRLTRPTTLADDAELTENIAREIVRDLREEPERDSLYFSNSGRARNTP